MDKNDKKKRGLTKSGRFWETKTQEGDQSVIHLSFGDQTPQLPKAVKPEGTLKPFRRGSDKDEQQQR